LSLDILLGVVPGSVTMASENEKHEYRPQRTENILNATPNDDKTVDDSYPKEEIERPAMLPSYSSTDVDDGDLKRVQTSKSVRDRRQFEPIHSGDRAELTRIASQLGGSVGMVRTHTSSLERRDTLAGVNLGDPVLDPNSPEFDVYKWSRM
jgi:ATP-binding cassette subfamily G (WHITE) protein 2 (PDR)